MFNRANFAFLLFILLVPLWIYLYLSLFNEFLKFKNPLNLPNVASFKSLEILPETRRIPVIMYHYVEINQNKDDFLRDNLNTNPQVFENQILTFKNAGYQFIWASEIEIALKDRSDQKYVVFTFDDGYETFYSQTYPIIKKHNVKVTNYIIADLVGKPNYMSKSQISQIYSEGLLEIGSHTLTHPDLTSISKEEAKRQILESKLRLESMFNTNVKSFCYPYGFYNSDLFEILKSSGYTNATTTKLGAVVFEDKLFQVNRIRPGVATGESLLKFIDTINY